MVRRWGGFISCGYYNQKKQMNSIKFIFIAIVWQLVSYYYKMYLASKELTFSIGSIKNISGKGEISWVQGLKVTNPTTTPILINAASVKNLVVGKEVGKTSLQGVTIIAAQSTTELKFNVNIPYTDLLPLLGGVLGAIASKRIGISFTGRVWAAGIPLGVSEKFEVDLNNIL